MMPLRRLSRLIAARHDFACLARDFVGGLHDEAHQSRPETLRLIRRLYVKSHGRSRKAWRALYALVRPARGADARVDAQLLATLRNDGLVKVPGFLPPDRVEALRAYFEAMPATPILEDMSRGEPVLKADAARALRLPYDTPTVMRAPGVLDLLADPMLQQLAAAYLGCEPIFTGVDAWWSLADAEADDQALSFAAQLFHFDHDWPVFLKFFFYLTEVGSNDGPFTYVLGTHKDKREWQDGRVSDAKIKAAYGDRVHAVLGAPGDLIAADTVGYHKGERVRRGPRLMLQVEFGATRLGAGFQYERYPRELRPASAYRHTFDVFCEPS